VEEWQPPELP
ncbi:hypothetical protein ACH57_14520, partial [Salmonella enterica subsp. enterica serovar Typhimurium]